MASVIIVDDSAFQRQIIKTALNLGGFSTLEAASAKECLNLLKNHQPQCICIDLLMPEINGFQLLEILAREYPAIPVIVGTADIQVSTKEKCLSLGAKEVLNKPLKKKDLVDAVNKVIN